MLTRLNWVEGWIVTARSLTPGEIQCVAGMGVGKLLNSVVGLRVIAVV
jgi:hypothetical protein